MYKKIILMALVIAQWANANSQSISRKVIASAGGIVSNSNTSISFTIGETVIGTFSSTNNIITQGFQQPNETGVVGAPITGVFKSCDFTTANKLSISATGGTWASSSTAVATVSSNGTVMGVSNGTANISYTYVLNGISYISNIEYVVAAQAQPAAITGSTGVCAGSTIQLSNATSGGVWKSNTTSQATVSSTGVVTGVNAGTATIQYTVTNAQGCSNFRTQSIAVKAQPAVPTISYSPINTVNPQSGVPNAPPPPGGGVVVCRNRTFILRGKPADGVWSVGAGMTVSPINSQDATVSTVNIGFSFIRYTSTDSKTGCSNGRTMNTNIVACASKGINNQGAISNEQFTIYPNPAHSIINLKVDKLIGTGSIVVTDLYGKQIKQQSLSLGINAINVSNFAKGMYLVSVITESGKQTQKVIVE